MAVYKRGKIYHVKFTFKGQPIRCSAKTTVRSEALEYEQKLRKDLETQWRGGEPSRTYSEAALRFIDHYLPKLKPNAADRYLQSMRMIQPYMEGVLLKDINKKKIAEIVEGRKRQPRKITDATIRRDLAYLSSLLSCAVEWDWLDVNPVKSYSKRSLKEAKRRVRYLSKTERKDLEATADAWLKPLIIFAAETGVRFEEQFSLTWRNVDFEANQILLVDTKTGDDRMVPLSPLARAQIKAQGRHPNSKYVFYRTGGGKFDHDHIIRPFKRALARAEINDFTWHDLRHTFASWAIKGWHSWLKEKMPLTRLQKWLGHATIHMTLRYAHLDVDDLHDSMKQGTKSGTRPKDSRRKK